MVGKVGNWLTTEYLRFLYNLLPKLYPLRLQCCGVSYVWRSRVEHV